jgi:hypothetical protein
VVFSVIEGVLLKPLSYPRPDELIGIWSKAPGINIPGKLNIAPFLYFIDREQNTTPSKIPLLANHSGTGFAAVTRRS